MKDLRTLCDEAIQLWDADCDMDAVINEMRTVLAQPEPVGPTDEELLHIYGIAKRDHCYEGPIDDWPKRAERAATVHGLRAVLTRYARPTIEPEGTCQPNGYAYRYPAIDGTITRFNHGQEVNGCRPLYAIPYWLGQPPTARPAIEPVPVSERLPGPEDCDAEGRCWFFHTSTIGGNEWFLSQLPKISEWYRWQSITHWLPHHALPVPSAEVSQ
jgi:hypothetical protein